MQDFSLLKLRNRFFYKFLRIELFHLRHHSMFTLLLIKDAPKVQRSFLGVQINLGHYPRQKPRFMVRISYKVTVRARIRTIFRVNVIVMARLR